jgi:hypothetical protein
MFLVLTRELNSVPRYRLLNLIAPAQSNGVRYSVGSSAITIEPLIVLSFPPLEISPSQGLFFTQCSSVSKRAYSTKPHAFLQYFIPKFKLCKIILDPLKGGGFFSPPISVGWSFYRIRGHAKASTTLDIYGHLIPVMQEDAARVMDEIVTPIRVDVGKVSEVNPLPLTNNDLRNGF